MISTY